jgi:MFS family permease
MPSLAPALSRRLPFYYGWVVIAVGFLTLGMGASVRAVFGLLFPPIIEEFGWERGITASVFSVGFILAAIAFPAIGAAVDRWGPQRILALGALVVAAGFVATTVSSTPWHFYLTLGLVVVGGSTSFAYNGHFIFLPSWFERRRGLAIGIACTGAGIIAIVLFPQIQVLIDRGGWRTACLVMASILVVVVVPLNVLLLKRRPADLGLVPDGVPASAAPGSAGATRIVDPVWAGTDWTLGKAMRTSRFWCFGLAFHFALFAWYAILVHQTKFLHDLGFDRTLAALALGLVPMFGVAGQLVLGALSDRIGREWTWSLACLGFFVTYLAMLLLARGGHPALVWLLVVAQGLLGYGMTPAIGAIPADLFQGRNYGRIFGVLAIFGSSGAALGPWVLGLVYDRTGSYDAGCLLAMALAAASAGLVWLAAPRKVRGVGLGRVST